MRKILLFIPFIFSLLPGLAPAQICSTPGKDGNPVNLTGIINSYYQGLGTASAGAQTIQVGPINATGSSTPISNGDLLLIIQIQDGSILSNNDSTYGNGLNGRGIISLGNTGHYEYVKATSSIISGTLSIEGAGSGNGLLNSYKTSAANPSQGQSNFEVIRVPQYGFAQLGSGLTAAIWNGSSGGVLAFDVAGALYMNSANISVNGKGFRGGGGINQTGGAGGSDSDYVAISGSGYDGSKGEGIAGTPRYVYQNNAVLTNLVEGYPSGSVARGAPGNAGGGGTDGDPAKNDQNSGGGGGANQGSGGNGGNTQTSNLPFGGLGGASISAPGRVFFGGGGGAGSRNNGTGFVSSGGAGGGMIFIRSGSIVGAGTLNANGAGAVNSANDGGGGGGAGGSILISSLQGSNASLTLMANGGSGASTNPGGPDSTSTGPGGGGGGGLIMSSDPSLSSQTYGATNGTTSASNASFGAGTGLPGIIIPGAGPNFQIGIPSGATCSADQSISLSVNNSSPLVGSLVNFTLIATNNGPNTAYNSRVLDTLPKGYSFVSDSGSTLYNANTGIWTIGNLASGNSQTLVIRAKVLSTGNYTNTAVISATSFDPATGNNTVSISTTPFSPPFPRPDSSSTMTNKPILLQDITANDVMGTYPINIGSVDLDTLTSGIQSSITIPNTGVFSVSDTGTVLFNPINGFSGIAETYYTVADQFGNSSGTKAFIKVKVYPIAQRDTLSAPSGTPVKASVWTMGIGNINPKSVKIVQNPLNGTAQVDTSTGNILFTSNNGFAGQDSVGFILCDRSSPIPLCSNTAFLVIHVKNPILALPIPNPDSSQTTAGRQVTLLAITKNDIRGSFAIDSSTVDLDTLVAGIQNSKTLPGIGTLFVDSFGDARFVPVSGFSGIANFYYDVSDIAGNTSTKTGKIQIKVYPSVAKDSVSTKENMAILINELVNDQGNLNPASVKIISNPKNGSLLVNSITGSITYTPKTGFYGIDSLYYMVCDKTQPMPLCSASGLVIVKVLSPIAQKPRSDIALTAIGNTSVLQGDTITYTFTINNNGPNSGTQLVFTDPLPAGVSLLTGSFNSVYGIVSYNANTKTINWTSDSLLVGQVVNLSFKVLANATGTIKNTGSISSSSIDSLLTNNIASVSTLVTTIQFKIPQAFTPNGDGKNDVFEIGGLDPYPDNYIEIYNRWGNMVYKTTSYGLNGTNWWDGSGLSEGTYYYFLHINMGTGIKTFSGYITLLRNLKP